MIQTIQGKTRIKAVCALSAALFIAPVVAYSQGFSGTLGMGEGKTVGIKQLLPAAVNLNEKRIKIQATSALAKTNGELVTILETKLVTMIQRDPRFIVDNNNPQTILKFTVTNSYVDEKKYDVGTGATAKVCDAFVGKVEVSYQALDASNNAPLDSENLVAVIEEKDAKQSGGVLSDIWKRGKGACGTDAKGSMHEAQDYLIDQIVHQMGQRAAPTEEIINVKLPGRKLEKLSRLAMAQRWSTLAEEAEKMEPLPKPDEDAYRIYLIALANEAQAYDIARESAARDQGKRTDITEQQADADFQKAQQLIDKARKLYKDAIQAKPNEKEFQEPDNRMEKAISVYATISRHKEEYQKFLAQQKAQPPPDAKTVSATTVSRNSAGPPVVKAAAGSSPLDQVVSFCKAGVDMSMIMDYINDPGFLDDAKASSYTFNVRTDPLTLHSNCQDKAPAIQTAMRARLARRKLTAASGPH